MQRSILFNTSLTHFHFLFANIKKIAQTNITKQKQKNKKKQNCSDVIKRYDYFVVYAIENEKKCIENEQNLPCYCFGLPVGGINQ